MLMLNNHRFGGAEEFIRESPESPEGGMISFDVVPDNELNAHAIKYVGNGLIYWGDGTHNAVSSDTVNEISHSYPESGTAYTIMIVGNIVRIQAYGEGQYTQVRTIHTMNLEGYTGEGKEPGIYNNLSEDGEFLRCYNIPAIGENFALSPSMVNCDSTFASAGNANAPLIIKQSMIPTAANANMRYMFCGYWVVPEEQISIGSNVSSLERTFGMCVLENYPLINANFAGSMRGCFSATKVSGNGTRQNPITLPIGVTDVSNMFYNSEIYRANVLIPHNIGISNFNNMYRWAGKLQFIDDEFKLPAHTTSAVSMFDECLRLLGIPSSFWPSAWSSATVNLRMAFYKAGSQLGAGLSGTTVPAALLWNNPNVNVIGDSCFYQCNWIENYGSIPSSWKKAP